VERNSRVPVIVAKEREEEETCGLKEATIIT
jgi:hypothetical protein